MKELVFKTLSEVEIKEVDWLWYPYLPFGKLAVIEGDPGAGKTTFIMQILAALTTRKPLPFDNREREPMHVIYQTAEDGYDDTIKPRFIAAGGNPDYFHFIEDKDGTLDMLDERLEKAIIETAAKVLVLDPIQAYFGEKRDMNRDNEVRPVMRRISDLADKYNCSMINTSHLTKDTSVRGVSRHIGSMDITAAARSVLLVATLRDNKEVRAVAHVKSSLAPNGDNFTFILSKEDGFHWGDKTDLTEEENVGGSSHTSEKERAKEFLIDILSAGPVLSEECYKKAEAAAIGRRTLETAKSEINAKSKKEGTNRFWSIN